MHKEEIPRYILYPSYATLLILTVKYTPALIRLISDLTGKLSRNWTKMSMTDKAIAAFLISGHIVPYFSLAFYYLMNKYSEEN